tara:strand:+ start:916 stop:1854 length:939 start_codon:yes stop_codon:yes gene_type:complete
MITLPTHNIFIEGPDCSGKTTLVKNVHNATAYKWHLMDRSQISRRIFARMYNRKLPGIAYDFKREVFDLNNIFVILIPEWNTVQERFEKRGDDLHDVNSLKKVYDAFVDSCGDLIGLPNVHIFSPPYLSSPEKTRDRLISLVRNREDTSLSKISYEVSKLAMASPRSEATSLCLSLFEDTGFEKADSAILKIPSEKEYYESIFYGMMNKIDAEVSGKNEYNLVQNSSSRRFIYTNDSCISLVHALSRDRRLDIQVVMRSTDVTEKLENDLNFIYYLSSQIFKRLSKMTKLELVQIRLNFNSAHILNHINPVC